MMGLFDSIAGSVMGKLATGGNPMLQAGLDIMKQYGGPQGLLKLMRAQGLQAEVDSWLDSGSNLPLTVEQVVHVFGARELADMARQFDFSAAEFNSKLAEYLPKAIDRLSPDGKLPSSQGELMARAFSLLK